MGWKAPVCLVIIDEDSVYGDHDNHGDADDASDADGAGDVDDNG